MPDSGCDMTVQALNFVFQAPLIWNDGHEILARLNAGDDPADIAEDTARKFRLRGAARSVREVMDSWPPVHRDAVRSMVQWALEKIDTDDRILIRWKGDAENPETVTKFELRDHTLLIEFAHPPRAMQAGSAGGAGVLP